MGPDPGVIDRWLEALPGASDLPFWPPCDTPYLAAKLYSGLSLENAAARRSAEDTLDFKLAIGPHGKPRGPGPVEIVSPRLHVAEIERLAVLSSRSPDGLRKAA